MWPFKQKKPQLESPKPIECVHKYREFDWYKQTSMEILGYNSNHEPHGRSTVKIYKPYVCIHCKNRKDILLDETTRADITWTELKELDDEISKRFEKWLKPQAVVEEEVSDFQIIDREYLKLAQQLFPDREIIKEDSDEH